MKGSVLLYSCVVLFTSSLEQLFVSCDEGSGSEVTHDDSRSYIPGPNCPNHWPMKFTNCAGERQSPIDISKRDTIYDERLDDINLVVIQDGDTMTLKNNGHSVGLTGSQVIHIDGAGLADIYQVAGPHFHWGNSSQHGSEHTFDNGKAYPLEMHIVTYNREKYTDLGSAVMSGDGNALAVFGILFQLGAENNTNFQPMIENLHKVQTANSEVTINVKLQDLLPKMTSNYYRYLGSLTTPKCYEVVIWTLFDEKVFLSEYQLNEFRKLLDEHNLPLVNNYRPVQALNDREISRSFQTPGYKIDDPEDLKDGSGVVDATTAGYLSTLLLCVAYALFQQ